MPVTIAFEVLSPNNSVTEMADKLAFYEEHGVEEYYVYDPDKDRLLVYLRRGSILQRQRQVQDFISPRLRIRFDTSGPEMTVYRPDGQPFLTYEKLLQAQCELERRARIAAQQRLRRLAELSRKVRRQEVSGEELAELERLEPTDAPG